ncbi:MAG TPA: isoprenylcysteine carboxylmethyltransferase family protein [Xanthobacteraceae bacterium]
MLRKLIIQNSIWLAVMALLLFVPAGTLAWPQAWVFLIELGGASILLCGWLYIHDRPLMAQRMSGPVQRDQPLWDRIFMICLLAFFVVWFLIMGLDFRFGWSRVPLWAQVVGALGVLWANYVFWLVFRANSYAAPVVKIQQERGHRIVTTGPYAIVRHPMYAGAIGFALGTPLLLGSWYGLALGVVMIAAFGYRAVREEATLAAQFPDYADYAARVRYRLVPFLW